MIKRAIFAFLLLFIIACVPNTPEEIKETVEQEVTSQDIAEPGSVVHNATGPVVSINWKDIELKDVRTGDLFKISDFNGKTVLLESFAVWCPKCKQQQDIFKDFAAENPNVVLISLDTDPNEDEERVKGHINRYGYDWLYAVAPADYTKQLIDEFGLGIISAPSTPVILICGDQKTRLTATGIKDVEELKSEIAKGC